MTDDELLLLAMLILWLIILILRIIPIDWNHGGWK